MQMKAKLTAGVLALALTGGLGAFGAQSAFASGPSGKTVCSTMTGNSSTTISISGCVDAKGANTGGGAAPISIVTLAAGGTVVWNSTLTTTFAAPVIKAGNAKKCPGYVKPTKGVTPPPEPTEVKFKGAVTADTSGMKVPGKYQGDVCVDTSGNITALKPLKVS